MRLCLTAAIAAAFALSSASALASHHFMQIEQVIGGINGDVERQAIQLRMRSSGQQFVDLVRMVAFDAAGENPVLVMDFPTNVDNGALGERVLIATAKFATQPEVLADFVMDRAIPESYINAGRLTFETQGGLIYWSVCWGGDAYTGATGGTSTNDSDGEFGPCFDGPLPAASRQALLFQGVATDPSSDNITDYAVTAGPATFTNNAAEAADVTNVVVYADGFDR